jgi:hypothetical protein
MTAVNQRAFDTIVKHLASMKKPSMRCDSDGDEMCAYRGANGAKCAVGVLIPDRNYVSTIEGKGGGDALVTGVLYAWARKVDDAMLYWLQEIHDDPNAWDEKAKSMNLGAYHRLVCVAETFALKQDVLKAAFRKITRRRK